MSIWVAITGALVTANCLLAWSSNSHGAKCLSMWTGGSFGLGLFLTTAGRLLAPYVGGFEAVWETVFHFPWQNVMMAEADLFLLVWLLNIIARNDDLQRYRWPLIGIQFTSLTLHLADMVAVHRYPDLYYGALDALLLSIIAINTFMSARHGVNMVSLLPFVRRLHHRSRHTG